MTPCLFLAFGLYSLLQEKRDRRKATRVTQEGAIKPRADSSPSETTHRDSASHVGDSGQQAHGGKGDKTLHHDGRSPL